MARTLIDSLKDAASVTHKGFVFLNNDLQASEWSFAELAAESVRRGQRLIELGLRKGDRLALIIPDGEDFVLTFLGAITVGVVPVPMYPPLALGKLDGYIDAATRILRAADAKMLVTTKTVAPVLWSLLSKVRSLTDLVLTDRLHAPRPTVLGELSLDVAIAPEDTAFLQFTSGSTSDPKGVVVTHAGLIANTRAIMFDGLTSDPHKDRGLSWLPLYHDMGLIGFVIAPLVAQVPIVFVPTLSFVKRPNIWMELVSKYRATITFAPNFAFGLASKRVTKQRLAELDLSCLRVVGCGAEPIHPATVATFVETFKPAGLNENAMMPCYGMAEATLAMAFDDLTRPMQTITIDRHLYESRNIAVPLNAESDMDAAEKLELVSCGSTFPDHDLKIMGSDGKLLPERSVGEIVFRGPSVSAGYFRNKDASQALLRDGWLHTGDLGFMINSTVYISGREKDIIIFNGRNYYPQAIEWVVEEVPGVRRGNVVAFSIRGKDTEQLIVVAETKQKDHKTLSQNIQTHVKTTLGLPVAEVALVPAGSLPKTSSGKLQRRKTRFQYENQTLGREGNRALSATATRVMLFRHFTSSAFARIQHRVKSAFPTWMTTFSRKDADISPSDGMAAGNS